VIDIRLLIVLITKYCLLNLNFLVLLVSFLIACNLILMTDIRRSQYAPIYTLLTSL